MPFYAVARGHRPGIYTDWPETKKQTERFPNVLHKKFPTEGEALKFIKENCAPEVYIQIEADWRAISAHNEAARSVISVQSGAGRSPVSIRNESSRSVVSIQNEAARSGQASGQGFLEQPKSEQPNPRHYKFYAVARGRVPGVYTTWEKAEEQTNGWHSKKVKGFPNWEEAQEYVDDYRRVMEGDPSDSHPMDPSTLVAFTDGSAVNNGTAYCRAGWACIFPHNQAWNRAQPLAGWLQTNNRAEYSAAIEAMLRANLEDSSQVKPLYIYSDSMLLIRSMTEWLPGWIAEGWIKADERQVKNIDLLKRLVSERGERRIIWRHVTAHTNRRDWKSKWNDLADQMAKEQTRNDFSLKRGRPTTERESEIGGGYRFKRGKPMISREPERGGGYNFQRERLHYREFDYQSVQSF